VRRGLNERRIFRHPSTEDPLRPAALPLAAPGGAQHDADSLTLCIIMIILLPAIGADGRAEAPRGRLSIMS